MATFFDVVTVTCFVALVIAYFQFTDRSTRTLVNLTLAGIVFAVANQVGNGGGTLFACVLILSGVGFAFLVVRR
jgi:hypothetical protein